MALTKQTILDKKEILSNGTIQVRKRTQILEDGVAISSSFHRYVVHPSTDKETLEPEIKVLADVLWTDEVVAEYEAKQAANEQVA